MLQYTRSREANALTIILYVFIIVCFRFEENHHQSGFCTRLFNEATSFIENGYQ